MTKAPGYYHVQESGCIFKHDDRSKNANLKKKSSSKIKRNKNIVDDDDDSDNDFLVNFRNDFEVRVLERPNENELVLEFNHVDASFINALRRILLAEVPTVALEKLYMWNNTGLIHDEVLAHRLGLIPLQVDARLLDDPEEDDADPTDRDTLVFKLDVSCPRPKKGRRNNSDNKWGGDEDEDDDENMMDDDDDKKKNKNNAGEDDFVRDNAELEEISKTAAAKNRSSAAAAHDKNDEPMISRPYTKHVYSSDLQWIPQGPQVDVFGDDPGIRPVHEDILIAKLRPGQAIELEAHGRRGIGKDHAKYCPVATVSYRLRPAIEILEPIYDKLAEELVHLYEPGVFELVNTKEGNHKVKAKVCNPYVCTMSRNYMRNPILKKSLKMTRVPDCYIFSIESVGMYKPGVLVAEALKVLQLKCQRVMDLAIESTEIEAK